MSLALALLLGGALFYAIDRTLGTDAALVAGVVLLVIELVDDLRLYRR